MEMTKMEKYYWHIHHGILVERAYEPIHIRKQYIREQKPLDEIPLRLKLIRRVKNEKLVEAVFNDPRIGNINKSRRLNALHRKECGKDCPWMQSTENIFNYYTFSLRFGRRYTLKGKGKRTYI